MEYEEDYGMFDKLSFDEKIKRVFGTNDVILNEKLFDIKSDVEMLWTGLESAIEVYKKDPQKILDSYKENGLVYKLTSAELNSEPCKEAHKINPVTILLGFLSNYGNVYNPDKQRITISVNKNAVLYLGPKGMDALPEAIKMYPVIGKEFDEDSLKGSIAHELSHWLDNTLHNKHLEKEIKKYQASVDKNKPKYSPAEWAYITNHEIDANIHAIASLKDKYNKRWDTMSFLDVLNLKPSLVHLFKSIGTKLSKKQYDNFIKRFFGRLARENMLGKNMKPLSYDVLKDL
jgi:hypothetical protein